MTVSSIIALALLVILFLALDKMIHEAAFDALTAHKIPFDPLVVHTLIAKITTALADECDTGTTTNGDVYHLVPVTTYIPIEKAVAA